MIAAHRPMPKPRGHTVRPARQSIAITAIMMMLTWPNSKVSLTGSKNSAIGVATAATMIPPRRSSLAHTRLETRYSVMARQMMLIV